MKATENTWLVIPIDQLSQAKRQAGKLENGENAMAFDPDKKLWYARPGAELDNLKAYRIDSTLTVQDTRNYLQEFGDFIRACGGELKGLPTMDGKTHRLAMSDDKPGSKSGVYVGHVDGFANGWFKDHRQTDRNNWSPNSAKPDPVKMAHLRAQAAQDAQRREAELIKKHAVTAERASTLFSALPAAPHTHPYLVRKGVKAARDLRLDDGSVKADASLRLKDDNQLIIPLRNVAGDIRTLQAIDPEGKKRLATGGEKVGNFCVVGGTLKNGQPLVLAEGYATAASAAMALQHPVVMTVDSGNLVKVAGILHAHYPDSPVLVLGDEDLPTATRKNNPGREKAEEAARLTGGVALIPDFTDDELHHLKLSDFNDLHQQRGLDTLRAILQPAFDALPRPDLKEEHTMTDMPEQPGAQPPSTPNITQDAPPLSPATGDISPVSLAPQEIVVENIDIPAPDELALPPEPGSHAGEETGMPVNRVTDEYADYAGMAEEIMDNDQAQSLPFPDAIPTPPEMAARQDDSPRPVSSPSTATAPQSASAEPPSPPPPSESQAQEVDGIHIEMPDGQARPVRIDTQELTRQLTNEMAPDGKKVTYSLAGEPAFIDYGHRITMADPDASKNDRKVLIALIVASKTYQGRIELTGSEEFKARAIALIAEYDVKVTMKNPLQQRMLDEARQKVADEPAPGEIPVVMGTPTAAIIPEEPVQARTESPLPPELRPVEPPQTGPQHASRQETQAGLTGTLLGHGPEKYQFDALESPSYYLHLRTVEGERYVWGKELYNALNNSGLKTGDPVTLAWLGSKAVTVTANVRDEQGKVVKVNGIAQTHQIETKRNQWSLTPAIDPSLLVSHEAQASPPASLLPYDMARFVALQQQVHHLASEAGVTLPPLPEPGPLLWMKPNGAGTPPPETTPSALSLPEPGPMAGTELMRAMNDEHELRLLLVKGAGDCVQGIVKYQDAWHPVLGTFCTLEDGRRYLSLNAVTPAGLQSIGIGNAINHEAGANNAFVFKLSGEKEKLCAPISDQVKRDPALHKHLGFEQAYAPPAPQRRDDHTARHTPSAPRPGA